MVFVYFVISYRLPLHVTAPPFLASYRDEIKLEVMIEAANGQHKA
jgi:hypothetical protein